MNEELKQRLVELAEKYENPSFIEKDPSQFMHRYSNVRDQETSAFIAANLAFGRRDQILKHVQYILDASGKSPADWILDKGYEKIFPESTSSFYRMYSYNAMRLFCTGIRGMLLAASGNVSLSDFDCGKDSDYSSENIACRIAASMAENKINADGSIGCAVHALYADACRKSSIINQNVQADKSNCRKSSRVILTNSCRPFLSHVISEVFPAECSLVPHSTDGAAKKVNMMLRWLVRDNSPVDLGLWKKWYLKTDLIMPLDTHVIQEAVNFGIFPVSASGKTQSASLKTAVALTEEMRSVFPDDPVRGDFALFGLGVDDNRED